MLHKHSTIVEAYGVLGLDEGSPLDVVKNTYKQLALRTHPDKNPDNANATAQFQRISEAYNVLLKHLDRSSLPPRRYTYTSFQYEDDEDDDFEDDDDCYDEDYDSDHEENLDFYMYLFEEMMRGRANRYANKRFQQHRPTPETSEQYQARIRRMREEQEAAERRRASEEAVRKAALERERERERREADERQRMKTTQKKAQAEALKKSTEQKARAQQERLQTLRSGVFAAARRGDAVKVKKAIWEDNVDAAGGEMRTGAEAFIKSPPKDPNETLLHIVAARGDVELVQWLDTHGTDAEERNSAGLTAFHVTLQRGHIPIIHHFFESYPPLDPDHEQVYRVPDSKSLLRLALDSREPEVMWMILDKRLASEQEINDVYAYVTSPPGKKVILGSSGQRKDQGKLEEIVNLLTSFGGQMPPPKPTTTQERGAQSHSSNERIPETKKQNRQTKPPSPTDTFSSQSSLPDPITPAESDPPPLSERPPPQPQTVRSSRGQYHRRPFRRQNYSQEGASSPSSSFEKVPSTPFPELDSQPNGSHNHTSSFGRGRGRGRGRGYSRGRGQSQPQPQPSAS